MQVRRRLHVGRATITLYCVQHALLARISSLGRLRTLHLITLLAVRKLRRDLGVDGGLTLTSRVSQMLNVVLEACAALIHLPVEELDGLLVGRHEGAAFVVLLGARHQVVMVVEGHSEVATMQVRLRFIILASGRLICRHGSRLNAIVILQAEADETVGYALRAAQPGIEALLIELDLAPAQIFIHALNLRARRAVDHLVQGATLTLLTTERASLSCLIALRAYRIHTIRLAAGANLLRGL